MSDARMLEEYKFLRQELETNRKFVFERPLLIVGATLTIAAALRNQIMGILWFLPLPFLTILFYNLWFTCNRLRSNARIVAYIQLVHEGSERLLWIGWETALHEFRRRAYRVDRERKAAKKTRKKAATPPTPSPGTYHSMGFYDQIFYFHIVLALMASLLTVLPNPAAPTGGRIDPGVMVPVFVALPMAVFLFYSFYRFRPQKIRHLIDRNQAIWREVLPQPQTPSLLIPLQAVKEDPALAAGARGARKIMVTARRPDTEEPCTRTVWAPPAAGEKAGVLETPDTELAYFTHTAAQDRHYHTTATEIYTVLEGQMGLEAADAKYTLNAGDAIVIPSGTIHRVEPSGLSFLCQVVSIHCGGPQDKHLA